MLTSFLIQIIKIFIDLSTIGREGRLSGKIGFSVIGVNFVCLREEAVAEDGVGGCFEL